VLVQGFNGGHAAGPFMQVAGEKSALISLMNNDFSSVKQVVVQGREVAREAVKSQNNIVK
jgi:hypothetical protein